MSDIKELNEWEKFCESVMKMNEGELKSQINFECSTTRRKSYIIRMHQRYAKLMTKRVGDELLNGGLL